VANLFVTRGDITKTVAVDAIATLINSGGMWFGGVDGAIQRIAGSWYHAQAAAMLKTTVLQDGQVVTARGNRANHNGSFNDVIFVIDNLQLLLGDLVYAALKEAKQKRYKSIAFPLMRSGVMLGLVEPNVKAVVSQMRLGIERFLEEGDVEIDIYIVVHSEMDAIKMLSSSMKLLNP